MKVFLYVVVVALPAIMVCAFIYFCFGATLFDFVPFYSDEVHYWHETFTFSQAGFAGGFYTIEEHPASFPLSHFGSHGPIFPMLYGTIGHFLGWQLYSAPIFNLVLIGIALCLFAFIAKLDNKQVLIMGAFSATFWPLLLLLPSNMQAGLNFTIAIVLASIFYAMLSKRADVSAGFKLASLVFIICASVLRPTWSLLLLPFFLLAMKDTSRFNIFLSLLKATIAISAIVVGFRCLAAPYPDSFMSHFTQTISLSFYDGIQLFMNHALSNISNLVALNHGHVLEILQRYQILFLIGILGSLAVIAPLKKRMITDKGVDDRYKRGPDTLFHLYNLGCIVGLNVAFYDVFGWRDYRVLAPHFFLTASLLIARSRKNWMLWLVVAIIASNIVLSAQFIDTFKSIRARNFLYDTTRITSFNNMIGTYLIYEEDASPWCNTLLAARTCYSPELLALPAGIGISVIYKPERLQPLPLKSRYFLLDDKSYEVLGKQLNIELLTSTSIGDIYLNLDSKCD